MPSPSGTPPGTLTERGQKSLVDLVEQQLNGGLSDAFNAVNDLPGFLAGPSPATPSFLPLYGIGRAACRSYARGFGPQNLPGFDSAWGGICGPYLGDIGEEPDPGSLERPFEGGQCEGVNYRIDWTPSAPGFTPGPQTNERLGPLSYSRAGTGTEDCGAGGGTYNVYTISNGVQAPLSLGTGCDLVVSGLTITRIDGGGGDTCGSPPPVYKPPSVQPGLPTVGPQPVDFPGIGPIDVDVSFGPDGEIIIDLPGIDTDITIDNPFEQPATGAGGDGPPLGPGTAGTASDSGDGGDDSGEAPDGQELVGLQVQVIEAPTGANTFNNVADTVYRGIGYIRMGYPGRLGLDVSGSAVLDPQFFHAQQRGLTNWAVRANIGYNLRTTPYYRDIATT